MTTYKGFTIVPHEDGGFVVINSDLKEEGRAIELMDAFDLCDDVERRRAFEP